MATTRKRRGIEVRHTAKGERRYRAEVWDSGKGPKGGRHHKTFTTEKAAISWQSAMRSRIENGEASVMDSPRLVEAWESWYRLARADTVLNNRGQRYKPSVLRGYEQSMRSHILPLLGHRRLTEVRVSHVQALVEQMIASGHAPRTVRNTIAPIRVLYKDAIRRELARTNPATGLALPSGEVVRDRIATPAEAQRLLAALTHDRALWATAFYAGLRAGELMALRWEDIDVIRREITVERSYDPKAREFVSPKSAKGSRVVPYPTQLVPFLLEAAAERVSGLVFGSSAVTPWIATTVRKRARAAWAEAGLEPITPHECRHTYASLMLASGIDILKVSKWMGHSSIQITVDRYGHLVPGDETEAMARFSAYLLRAPNVREDPVSSYSTKSPFGI